MHVHTGIRNKEMYKDSLYIDSLHMYQDTDFICLKKTLTLISGMT